VRSRAARAQLSPRAGPRQFEINSRRWPDGKLATQERVA